MKTVQTIELSEAERLTLSKTLRLIDQISDVVDDTMESVFNYFVDNSDITEDGSYSVKALHNIEEMRGEA
jgi:hypothetical protein